MIDVNGGYPQVIPSFLTGYGKKGSVGAMLLAIDAVQHDACALYNRFGCAAKSWASPLDVADCVENDKQPSSARSQDWETVRIRVEGVVLGDENAQFIRNANVVNVG